MTLIKDPTVRFKEGQLQVILLPEWENFKELGAGEFVDAVAYAREHPIDVPSKQDKDEIKKLIWLKYIVKDKETYLNRDWQPQDLTEYKLEGVRMEIKKTCIRNGDRLDCANEACWDLNECQRSPSKQIAVLLNN